MPSKYKIHPLPLERTFCMVKPDGVMRGLVGEVIKRLEQRGLKVVGMKMMHATSELVNDFYPKDPAWIERLGEKTLGTFSEYNLCQTPRGSYWNGANAGGRADLPRVEQESPDWHEKEGSLA